MEPLHLFTVFHLNLAYSAIEESERKEVIETLTRLHPVTQFLRGKDERPTHG